MRASFAAIGSPPVNINEVLEGHVQLDVACVDRLYLNAYVPNLQVRGQVGQFCRHLGQPIGSPAVIEQIGNPFRRDVDAYAHRHRLPVLHLAKPDRSRWDDRKLDHVRPYLDARERAGRYGVVAIVLLVGTVHAPVEVSRTLVFDDPRRARAFFESLVTDNVGIGRPEQVSMIFARQVRTTTKEPFRAVSSPLAPR